MNRELIKYVPMSRGLDVFINDERTGTLVIHDTLGTVIYKSLSGEARVYTGLEIAKEAIASAVDLAVRSGALVPRRPTADLVETYVDTEFALMHRAFAI